MCFVPCRDGEPIEQEDNEEKYSFNYDGSELIIKKVDKSDEAEYICIAENKAGEQDATIHLKVFGELLPVQKPSCCLFQILLFTGRLHFEQQLNECCFYFSFQQNPKSHMWRIKQLWSWRIRSH